MPLIRRSFQDLLVVEDFQHAPKISVPSGFRRKPEPSRPCVNYSKWRPLAETKRSKVFYFS